MFRVIVGLTLFISLSSQAYVGSVSAATGESGRAAVEASETPFGNPATLAFITGYYFSAGFGAAHQSANGNSQDLAVSLMDNMKDTVIPTSLAYVQSSSRPEGLSEDVLVRSFKLSFGNFVRSGISFGLGINHDDTRLPGDRYAQTNVQSGFLWSPNRDFGFALTFDNMLKPSDSVPEAYRQQQKIGFGGSYNFKQFMRLKADIVSASKNTAGKPTFGAGMERYLNSWFILRWGLARNNELDANLYTAGLGFIGPKFGFHYAYENSPQNESLTRHSVDLAVPIW